MVGVSLYTLADTFFISVAGGADGITILNLCLPIYGVIFAIAGMIGVGSATRYVLAKSSGAMGYEHYFFNAVIFCFIFGIPFVIVGLVNPAAALRLMGADATIAAMGQGYARLFMIFTPFFMLNMVCNAFTRNDNAPTTAMLATLLSSLFNIVFDYVFVFPMGMGIKGAALATGISPVLGTAICLTHLMGHKNTVEFKPCWPRLGMLVKSCQLGIAAFVGEISSAVTTMVFNFLLLAYIGNIGVAAYGVIANLALVGTAIFNGLAQGAQPLFSKSYSQGNTSDSRLLLRMAIITGLALSAAIIGLCYGFTDGMIGIFNSEGSAQLAALAHPGLRLYCLGYLFASINIVVTGYFGATGKAGPAFVASIMRGIVAISLAAILITSIFGIGYIWLAFLASEAITLAVELVLARLS